MLMYPTTGITADSGLTCVSISSTKNIFSFNMNSLNPLGELLEPYKDWFDAHPECDCYWEAKQRWNPLNDTEMFYTLLFWFENQNDAIQFKLACV